MICLVVHSGRGEAVFDLQRDIDRIAREAKARCGVAPGRGDLETEIALEISEADTLGSLELAETTLGANAGLFANLLEWLAALVTFLTVLLSALRFVPHPVVRLVGIAGTRMISRVVGFQGAIIARKAANDSAFSVVRRSIAHLKKAA